MAENGTSFGKDFFDSIFKTAEYIMQEKSAQKVKSYELQLVKEKFFGLGDS